MKVSMLHLLVGAGAVFLAYKYFRNVKAVADAKAYADSRPILTPGGNFYG